MEHSVPGKVKAILSGHDSHSIWKKQLEAEAESLPGFWRHFKGKATVWPDLERKSDEKQDEWDAILERREELQNAYVVHRGQAKKKIL
ncbi:hypothetical protein GcM1_117003, partial [Golovinomyces cichoracearum]